MTTKLWSCWGCDREEHPSRPRRATRMGASYKVTKLLKQKANELSKRNSTFMIGHQNDSVKSRQENPDDTKDQIVK